MKKEQSLLKRAMGVTVATLALVVLLGTEPAHTQEATLLLVSDESTDWSADATTWEPAIACWAKYVWPNISGASWIWRTYQTDPAWEYANVPDGGWYFRKTFSLPPTAYNITGSIQANADNAYLLHVNGQVIGGDGTMSKDGPHDYGWKHIETFAVENLSPGENTILIRALNYFSWGDYYSNPAGLIFKATISYDVTPIPVDIDIKPGSCPNPLNVESKGVLAVAVLGTEEFDVSAIDIATVRLAGAGPMRSSYEDVASPVPDGNECECDTAGADGLTDLSLKFKTQDVVLELLDSGIGPAADEELTLHLTGALFDGTPIEGSDCMVIRGKVPRPLKAKRADINDDGVVNILDFAIMADTWLEYASLEY